MEDFRLFRRHRSAGVKYSIMSLLFLLKSSIQWKDAVMVQTAIRVGADCIAARNIKDYKFSPLPVYSPAEFLNLPFHQL